MLTPESYLDAVAWHLDGENYVHPSAAVADADLGENVQIMADVELEDVTVDNSVVVPEATIQGGELRRSLVDEACVAGLHRSGAVIGAHTRVNGQ